MSVKIRVSIADYKIAKSETSLISYALGSCVGIAMYQLGGAIGGLAHILLPRREGHLINENILKYADVALMLMREDLIFHGVEPQTIRAKIAGGANMFHVAFEGQKKSVGERNIEAVCEVLKHLAIPIVAKDVGGNCGRTIEFNPANGSLLVASVRGGTRVI